jgi:hypothetical protein
MQRHSSGKEVPKGMHSDTTDGCKNSTDSRAIGQAIRNSGFWVKSDQKSRKTTNQPL